MLYNWLVDYHIIGLYDYCYYWLTVCFTVISYRPIFPSKNGLPLICKVSLTSCESDYMKSSFRHILASATFFRNLLASSFRQLRRKQKILTHFINCRILSVYL